MTAVGVALIAAAGGAVPTAAVRVAAAEEAPGAFEPLTPCRLLDTRDGARRLAGGDTLDLDVAGRCGVPADATAVSVTITAVQPSAPGFLTAAPRGADRPNASVLNYERDDVVANLQLLALGDGAISIYSYADTDVVVDVAGAFVPSEGPSRAGRYVPVAPRRALDTRDTRRPAAGDVIRVATDVPDDAIAVAVNLTTTETIGADFFTAYPAGGDRPLASALNVARAGETRAAAMIVPIVAGEFDVFTLNGNHVIVDVVGYYTGEHARASRDGLFVPIVPRRLVDTRLAAGPRGGPRLWDGGGREFVTRSVTGGDAAAVAANVTVTRTEDAGFVVAHPAGTPTPGTSTVNHPSASRTVANFALVGTSDRGIAIEAYEATHLVVDVTGWFTGTPVAAGEEAPVNEPPPPRRVTIVGDSAFAGIVWNGAAAGLQGMVADLQLESCRRLVAPSCQGRSGRRPTTVVGVLTAMAPVGPEEVLVVTAGYDDWHLDFGSDFDTVVAAARARGFHHIVWVTYRSDVGYRLPGGGASNYAAMNQVLAERLATGAYRDVRVWDYDAYTAATPVGWFYGDGIHEQPLGSWGTADWLSRQVAAFDDKPCPRPWRPGGSIDDPCPDPLAAAADEGGLPDIAALYGL